MNLLAVLPKDVAIHPLSSNYHNQFVLYVSKSTSRNMPTVLGLMQQADSFAELDIYNTKYFASVFSLAPNQIPLLCSIIEMAKGWKGFHLFFNHRLINNHTATLRTLECYFQALQCNDTKAHCNIIQYEWGGFGVSMGFFNQESQKSAWLIPCQKLTHFYNRVDSRHPSSTIDQIQAMAVEKSCDWCPLLDLHGFKKL